MSHDVARSSPRSAGLLVLATFAFLVSIAATSAEAKAPGMRRCYGGICHRVMTLPETAAAIGKVTSIVASHYDDCRRDRFNPCGLTSSGEAFRPDAPDNTASSIHPDGTILLIRNPTNGHAAVVRVNNLGPFKGNRKLDVSRETARRLGFERRGVARLDVMVMHAPSPEETRYKRKRRYEPVAGYIGKADSIDHALITHVAIVEQGRATRHAAVACYLQRGKRAPQLALVDVAFPTVRPHA